MNSASKPSSLPTLNTITIVNGSLLDTTRYTVWVAGFMQQDGVANSFYFLQSSGSFQLRTGKTAGFININNGLTVQVPDVPNSGNNRLVFTITQAGTTPAAYNVDGYTAYPFPGTPGVCPPGPYDIFEFGPNAQYDVSAVDSFGINLSFSVTTKSGTTNYGVVSSVKRSDITTAFNSFVASDPYGKCITELIYTSPTDDKYPQQIANQFSAIVSPKDWLAINGTDKNLMGFWDDTVKALFGKGNQLSFFLNGATVGTYAGTCDGTQYTLKGPDKLTIIIPKTDFEGNQPSIQAVRPQGAKETSAEYAAFGQIEAAIFEAFSRGVVLDGVIKPGETKFPASYSSDAWTNTSNWYTDHANTLNGAKSVYDPYAKFFHCGKTKGGTSIFEMNAAGTFAMAYGFSLDENPNVGSTWPSNANVPSKTLGNVGSGDSVTITVGLWG